MDIGEEQDRLVSLYGGARNTHAVPTAASLRPFNNLLRCLNKTDFNPLKPHLVRAEAKAGELFYSPDDDAEIVHFSLRAEPRLLCGAP